MPCALPSKGNSMTLAKTIGASRWFFLMKEPKLLFFREHLYSASEQSCLAKNSFCKPDSVAISPETEDPPGRLLLRGNTKQPLLQMTSKCCPLLHIRLLLNTDWSPRTTHLFNINRDLTGQRSISKACDYKAGGCMGRLQSRKVAGVPSKPKGIILHLWL